MHGQSIGIRDMLSSIWRSMQSETKETAAKKFWNQKEVPDKICKAGRLVEKLLTMQFKAVSQSKKIAFMECMLITNCHEKEQTHCLGNREKKQNLQAREKYMTLFKF